MPHYKLAFLGFGNVGRALAQLLLRKRDELQGLYDITFSVTGIATARHGSLANPSGVDLTGALGLIGNGHQDPGRWCAGFHPKMRRGRVVREHARQSRQRPAGDRPRPRGAGSRDARLHRQ